MTWQPFVSFQATRDNQPEGTVVVYHYPADKTDRHPSNHRRAWTTMEVAPARARAGTLFIYLEIPQ